MKINLPVLSEQTLLALQRIASTPAFQAEIAIRAAQAKIAGGANIKMPTVERWTEAIYECATHQIEANSSFTAFHLGVIYDKLMSGETADAIEAYLQALKETYL